MEEDERAPRPAGTKTSQPTKTRTIRQASGPLPKKRAAAREGYIWTLEAAT